jgi:hypothetical protein
MYAKELTPKFADEKSMLLTRGLKKLSAVQKKLKIENLAKNGMLKPLVRVRRNRGGTLIVHFYDKSVVLVKV